MARVNETYYARASTEFQKAASFNSPSPLPHYFLGKLYSEGAPWTKGALRAYAAGRAVLNREAVQAYTRAIQLDPHFVLAYEARAASYHWLKQYSEAIKDFDKVLALDSENAIAYSGRGDAKMSLGQYLSAISDLGDAISRETGEVSLASSYENRADAYFKMASYREAIADYSKAIELDLADETFMLSLKQIRALYPEYNAVLDEALCQKLRVLFWPEIDYEVLVKKLGQESEILPGIFFSHLYEKRGDAYLTSNDFSRGVRDFGRIFNGMPDFAGTLDRWRWLGDAGDDKLYVDVKSVELTDAKEPVRLWIKFLKKNAAYSVQAFDLDCKAKLIREAAAVTYDSKGAILGSSEQSSDWSKVIPDTMGEHLYGGVCVGQ